MRAREELQKEKEESEVRQGLQLSALNENVATLKREWQGSQRRVAELEKQTDELRGEMAVLEATVQNNQDERRALLERLGHTHTHTHTSRHLNMDIYLYIHTVCRISIKCVCVCVCI